MDDVRLCGLDPAGLARLLWVLLFGSSFCFSLSAASASGLVLFKASLSGSGTVAAGFCPGRPTQRPGRARPGPPAAPAQGLPRPGGAALSGPERPPCATCTPPLPSKPPPHRLGQGSTSTCTPRDLERRGPRPESPPVCRLPSYRAHESTRDANPLSPPALPVSLRATRRHYQRASSQPAGPSPPPSPSPAPPPSSPASSPLIPRGRWLACGGRQAPPAGARPRRRRSGCRPPC